MELYSMPQLDKSPYSEIHYVERSNLPNTSIPVDVKKFSPVSGDILTSSAWSAVIHRPAEDSEPEDLPSTVDMDAIKGSPSTSLPSTGPVAWSESDRGHFGGGGDDDSESGDDDDDDEDDEDENEKDSSSESSSPNSDGDDADSESGTAQGSASDSDSESSSRNSYDSDSDSASSDSSCTSRSSESSHSSPSPAPKPSLTCEAEKQRPSSQELQQNLGGLKSRLNAHWNDKNDEKGDGGSGGQTAKDGVKTDERRAAVKKEEDKQHRKEILSLHPKEERADSKRLPVRGSAKGEEERLKDKAKEPPKASPMRNVRRKDSEVQACRTASRAKVVTDEVSSTRPGSVSTSCAIPHSFKDVRNSEERKCDRKTNTAISSTTIRTSTSATSAAVHDSSSDVELPAQIVKDAIKRIQVVSKSKSSLANTGKPVIDDDDRDDDADDDDSVDDSRAHYSSSLLQKFVESTERMSAKRNPVSVRSSGSKHNAPSGSAHISKEAARRRHSHLPQFTASLLPSRCAEAPVASSARPGPADLEVYCSVSNVSPDSGIYCVNGSPWHQSSPAHSPQHPLKTLPSPPRGLVKQDHRRKHTSLKVAPASSSKSPKKNSSHLDRHKDARVPPILSIDDSEDEAASSPLLTAPARRGRGRPKKAPPVLEPCLPYTSMASAKRIYNVDRSQSESRKQVKRKESESSDQSEERCDKILTYSTHRTREVQVTSQGVQCDQSEFSQIGQSKKKKKSQARQSFQSSQVKYIKPSAYSVQEKEKSHRKPESLQVVCDRVKKARDCYTYGLVSERQSKSYHSKSSSDLGSFKKSSLPKQSSGSPSCNRSSSSSSSKRRLATSVEKRKKGKRKGHAARLAAAAATLLSSSSSSFIKPDTTIVNAQPNPPTAPSTIVRPAKTQRPAEKVISLPHGIKPRKHKKQRKWKEHRKHSTRLDSVDPIFLEKLEKLVADFQKSCCISRIQQSSHRIGEGTRLPSIFRVKRIGKKRKGSERSKNSDRDSGPEAETSNPPVNPAPRDSRDKGSTGGKRRPKKSAVETPKGQRPEANNEQRLPLKKRHYHMSTAPNQQSGSTSSPEMSLDISSSAEEKRSNNDDSPTSSISSKASVSSQGRGNPSLSTPNVTSRANQPPLLKVTVVMPATSSSPIGNVFHSGETNLFTKADSSASFASVCANKNDPVPALMTMPGLEKTYSVPAPPMCSNQLRVAPSMCGADPPQVCATTNIKGSLSAGCSAAPSKTIHLSEEVCLGPLSGTCGSSVKVTKNSTVPVAKLMPELALNSSAVKSVADSSLVSKPPLVPIVNQGGGAGNACGVGLNSTSVITTSKASAFPSVVPAAFASAQASGSKCNLTGTVSDPKLIRNSYDEAIEACISKYSSDIQSMPLVPRAVITTPKKRHRMEMQGKPSGGKIKESESSVHSTTGNTSSTQAMKKTNCRSVNSTPVLSALAAAPESTQPFVQTKLAPPLPTPQALSPGGSKLPESGIFEPSSSTEHYIVNVSLPATPVKSAIAGLSKLKGSPCYKPSATASIDASATETTPIDSYTLTCHNLHQKKGILAIPLEEDLEGSTIETKPGPGLSDPQQLASEVDLSSAGKGDSDNKLKTKPKPKLKQDDNAEKLPDLKKVDVDVKTEVKDISHDVDISACNDLKEVRIQVEKLSSVNATVHKEKDTKQKAKSGTAVPKRRRKCNRTGFPVKRKKKKKESSIAADIKTEIVTVSQDQTSSDIPPAETENAASESRNLGYVNKPVKEEVCCDSTNVVKVEQKKESLTVILKIEDCEQNTREPKSSRNAKQEIRQAETCIVSHNHTGASDTLHCSAKQGEPSVSCSEPVPYIDRIPNKDKYMFAGFPKRLDAKSDNKVRKPSKAVIRAMRAKFSENISLPDIPSGNNKGSKMTSPNWSSDESDDSIDDPYECPGTPGYNSGPADELVKTENDEAGMPEMFDNCSTVILPEDEDSTRRRPKRYMKRAAAVSSCDESVKSKCSKSGKEGIRSTFCKTKTSNDLRTRNKRKSDTDDLPASVELRNPRSKKRPRTIPRMEVDSLETDGDESVHGEPQGPSTGGTGDALSETESTKNFSLDAKQPRWRKKYLPAGLFSDFFKLDEPRSASDSKKGLQYKPEDHPHGLLPAPYHCAKWLRQRKVNFQLPYDLWWLHTHNKLPGRDTVPSWNYKKIRTNFYNNVKPSYVHEPQTCNCKTPEDGSKGCGDDCINRLVYTECSPGICPLRDLCSNQKIQRHDWAPGLDRFMTKEKGWGVRTKLPIRSGEFILEYVGEVVSDREFKERMASIYTQDTHHYCLHLDGGLVIDGHRMGGDGRFVNHSCEPNCEMQKWSVNGLFRMALFALRDIEANEELGYDYNFSLFNAAEGQPCKCGFSNCRGVIGGKSQRVSVVPSTQNGSSSKVSVEDITDKKGSRKNKRKANRINDGERAAENMRQRKRMEAQRLSQSLALNIRQMSNQQRSFVQHHHCFLLRNLEKVRRFKEKLILATQRAEGSTRPASNTVKQSDVFLTQLNALSIPRNVRTRRLAQAEDNPELARNARLACVLRDLFNAVISAKDEKGEILSNPFMTLPNKRKLPLYYVRVREPLDFSTIEQNINSGLYCSLEAFDQDIRKVFNNNLRFYGRTTHLGIASVRLKKVYLDAKKEAHPQLADILGEALPASYVAEKDPADEEEVIRCICGLYRDEGMMIQCERCLVWQHCDCVKADSTFEHYLCEICHPRSVDLEIVTDPQPSHLPKNQTEHITLLRSDLQIRQGDTVYVLRDLIEGEGESQAKVTYKTIKDPKYGDMDIFRIERLWKDEKGERFAYGHHYLRPHETFHEPTRKFYPNEVIRVPLFEIISLDLIWARCWVLDPMTYCKGRPIEAVEEHVYICEYRVNKTAHLFHKISKSQSRANLCLKSYAFESFETRLKPVRTYTPHGPVPPLKPRVRGNQDDSSSTKSMQQSPAVPEEEEEVPLARRVKQRGYLNGILLRLLANQQCKQPLDVSYLLDPGRRQRKKPSGLNT